MTTKLATLGLVVVLGTYLLQAARPLHLEPDSVCYVMIAERAAEGLGFDCPGCPRDHCSILHPPGYPAVVALLIRADLAASWSFFAVNFLFLLVGTWATYGIFRQALGCDRATSLVYCTVGLLSFTLFKYVVSPLSDFVFYGLAMSCIFLLVAARALWGWRRWGAIAAGGVIAAVAIPVRTVGIALVPAIGWVVASDEGVRRWVKDHVRNVRPRLAVTGGVGVMLVVVAALRLADSDYVAVDLQRQYGGMVLEGFARTAGYRLREWGEIASNVPSSRLPPGLASLTPLGGAVAFVAAALSLWARRRCIGPAEVFGIGYGLIILVWPFYDTRFWLPVIPLFVGWAGWAVIRAGTALPRVVPVTYLAVFVLVGLAGQAYNTVRSWSGDRFPQFFSDAYLGPVYRAAWGMGPPSDAAVDSTALGVLRRYEPRARMPTVSGSR